MLDIESEMYELKRQLQDAKTTAESELKLVQLKVDQLTRENEEVRSQKREIDASLRKSQAENAQTLHQVRIFVCSSNPSLKDKVLSHQMPMSIFYHLEADFMPMMIYFSSFIFGHLLGHC